METSPNTGPSQARKPEQQTAANNVPKSGERPDQGAAPVLNPRADSVYLLKYNVLVPSGSVAYKGNAPTSKFVVVTVAPVEMPAGTRIATSQQVAVPA